MSTPDGRPGWRTLLVQRGYAVYVVDRPGYGRSPASLKRELRVFTAEEGATEHVGLDHLPHVSTFIADWVADTFTELSASPPGTGAM